MTNTNKTTNQQQGNQQKSAEYFNLTVSGIGYLNHVRQVNTQNGSFMSCVINALAGPTDSPTYTRFDCVVAGKETSSLINRCQRAVDEDRKVLIGFTLSNPLTDIFTLNKGEHAGEQRVSLKARLINISWIKIAQEVVYKSEKSEAPYQFQSQNSAKNYSPDSF